MNINISPLHEFKFWHHVADLEKATRPSGSETYLYHWPDYFFSNQSCTVEIYRTAGLKGTREIYYAKLKNILKI